MTTNFIVDPTSISESKIEEDILAYLDAQPDADKWAIFFNSSTGKNLVKLMSGLAAFFQYSTITARREAYIQFAKNRSSILGSSQFLGYSAFRGRNAIVDVTITPASSGVFSKWEELGSVKDRRLIVLEDTVKNIGVPVVVRCIIGEILEQTKIAPNQNLNVFKYTISGVSEDIRLFVDTDEVETGTEVADMLLGNFVIQSNAFGSVDAKSLNLIGNPIRYDSGSEIKLSWISLKDVNFTVNDVILDDGEGTLGLVTVVSIYQSIEDASSIVVNAPLRNETQNAVRGRRDQAKIFKQLTPKCVDAKGQDISAAVMRIFYVLENDLRLTTNEKNDILEAFSDYRPHGLQLPLIQDAVRNLTKLKIDIFLAPKKNGNVEEVVTEILSTKMYKLGTSLSLYTVEDELEALDFIKVARVALTGDVRASDFSYEIGSLVKKSPDNGRIYKATRIRYFSGVTQPVWPVIVNNTIIDGQIVWKAIPKDDTAAYSAWTASTDYLFLSFVKPTVSNGFIYQAVDFINKSGATEPTWPALGGGQPDDILGEKVKDGNIVWVARPLEGLISDWVATTNYKSGDLVVATNDIASDTVGVMFQAYAFLGKSGLSTPTFPTTLDALLLDGFLEWITLDPEADVFIVKDDQYLVLEFETTVS